MTRAGGTSAPIEVDRLIDASGIGALQIRVVVLCALVSLLDGFDLQAMSASVPTLAAQWRRPPAAFGPALSAALIGLAIGAIAAGPLGDRYGRTRLLLASMTLAGLAMLATASVTSMSGLFFCRLVTGVGLGGSMPNVIALTAEFAPRRRRTLLITLMFCGMPLGGSIGGFAAAELIRLHGWEVVFVAGGLLSLAVAALLPALPESLHVLVGRHGAESAIGRTLERIDPGYRFEGTHRFVVSGVPATGGSIAQLFSDARTAGTVILWLIFFCNLFALYVLSSWLPAVFRHFGWEMAQSLRAAATFQLGGIGSALLIGRFVDRFGPYRVLIPAYLAAVVLVLAIGAAPARVLATVLTTTLAGAFVVGAQFCINSLSAAFYPASSRATGVGWALGVGRVGAIVSPVLGGWLLGIGPEPLFGAASAALLACAIGMALLKRFGRPAQS